MLRVFQEIADVSVLSIKNQTHGIAMAHIFSIPRINTGPTVPAIRPTLRPTFNPSAHPTFSSNSNSSFVSSRMFQIFIGIAAVLTVLIAVATVYYIYKRRSNNKTGMNNNVDYELDSFYPEKNNTNGRNSLPGTPPLSPDANEDIESFDSNSNSNLSHSDKWLLGSVKSVVVHAGSMSSYSSITGLSNRNSSTSSVAGDRPPSQRTCSSTEVSSIRVVRQPPLPEPVLNTQSTYTNLNPQNKQLVPRFSSERMGSGNRQSRREISSPTPSVSFQDSSVPQLDYTSSTPPLPETPSVQASIRKSRKSIIGLVLEPVTATLNGAFSFEDNLKAEKMRARNRVASLRDPRPPSVQALERMSIKALLDSPRKASGSSVNDETLRKDSCSNVNDDML